jgi:hypothetical protein
MLSPAAVGTLLGEEVAGERGEGLLLSAGSAGPGEAEALYRPTTCVRLKSRWKTEPLSPGLAVERSLDRKRCSARPGRGWPKRPKGPKAG